MRSIDLQLQIRGDSEEQRPRQSVWDLNKCTTVGDWISGPVAVTACAGRERAGSLQPVSAGMRCKGQASSLCKRPGYIQGRQKPACVVLPPPTPPPSPSVVRWPWVGGGVTAGTTITVWREFPRFRWSKTYWRWGRCPWGRGPQRTPGRRFLRTRNLEREEDVTFQVPWQQGL